MPISRSFYYTHLVTLYEDDILSFFLDNVLQCQGYQRICKHCLKVHISALGRRPLLKIYCNVLKLFFFRTKIIVFAVNKFLPCHAAGLILRRFLILCSL